MSFKRLLAFAIPAGCMILTSASASDHWPARIVGRWKGISNRSPIVLTVTSETTGKTTCNNIVGTIKDVNGGTTGNMVGFYCPSSGAVEFLRYAAGSNVPYQDYDGNLSQSPAPAGVGGVLMAGAFGQYDLSFGPLGQARPAFRSRADPPRQGDSWNGKHPCPCQDDRSMRAASPGRCRGGDVSSQVAGAWTIRANDTQPFVLQVATQSADAPCAAITGVMGAANDPIMGYDCPPTGQVSFLRNSVQTGATYQVFTGQLSWAGKVTYMTGSFTNYGGNGDTGAYGFTASLRSN